MHPGRALRRRGREHDAPQEIGADERDLLRDEAADRETEQIHPLELECLEEGDGIVAHRLDRVGRPAGGRADAGVVEGDHTAISRERIDERGVPIVEIAAEVLQENKRCLARSQIAVGVLDRVVGRDAPRRKVDIGERRFDRHRTAAPTLSAALSTSSATSAGWETIATWLEGISVVVAPIRAAN